MLSKIHNKITANETCVHLEKGNGLRDLDVRRPRSPRCPSLESLRCTVNLLFLPPLCGERDLDLERLYYNNNNIN
jgi:hypothetical protein